MAKLLFEHAPSFESRMSAATAAKRQPEEACLSLVIIFCESRFSENPRMIMYGRIKGLTKRSRRVSPHAVRILPRRSSLNSFKWRAKLGMSKLGRAIKRNGVLTAAAVK